MPAGDVIAVMETMKMEMRVTAHRSGRITLRAAATVTRRAGSCIARIARWFVRFLASGATYNGAGSYRDCVMRCVPAGANQTAGDRQLGMRCLLSNAPALHHHHAVGMLDGGRAVGR